MVCVLSNCMHWNPSPQSDGLEMGPSGGNSVLEVESSCWYQCPYKRRHQTAFSSLPPSLFLSLTVSPLPREEMRKTVLTRTGPCWHCDLGLPRTSAELWEIYLLFKPVRRWEITFVVSAIQAMVFLLQQLELTKTLPQHKNKHCADPAPKSWCLHHLNSLSLSLTHTEGCASKCSPIHFLKQKKPWSVGFAISLA